MRLAIVLSAFILIVGWCVGRPVESQAPTTLPHGEPLVTIVLTATPAPVVYPTPGAPQRVQFERGSYGATLTGTTSTRYLLWAAQGQTFTTTLTASSTALVSLYGPDGKPLYEQLAAGYTAAATLPSNGDYALEVRSSGAYTVGVEIR